MVEPFGMSVAAATPLLAALGDAPQVTADAKQRGKFPKLGILMGEAENDVLAFMTFPRAHWTQI